MASKLGEHLEYIEKARLPKEEGWGYFQQMEWGVTEIAAWVVWLILRRHKQTRLILYGEMIPKEPSNDSRSILSY